MFDEHEFAAVAGAALSIGEDVAYCVPYGRISLGWDGTYEQSILSLADYGEYRRQRYIAEHLLYSVRGTWGVATSHRMWGLAGGPRQFIDQLVSQYPNRGEDMTVRAVETWEAQLEPEGKDGYRWVFPCLVNLYGETRARELWKLGPSDRSEPPNI